MRAEVFAAISALCFAGSFVAAKRGLATVSVLAGVLVNIGVAWLVLVLAVALDPPDAFSTGATAIFVLAGIAGAGLGTWAALTGVDKLGPSVAVPIQQGTRPVIASVIAMLWLGESLGLVQILGVSGIVLGGWRLSRSGMLIDDGGSSRPSKLARLPEGGQIGSVDHAFRPGVVFPLMAGGGFALSDVLSKQGLESLPHPAFGAMVGMGATFLLWMVASFLLPRWRRRLRFGPGVAWLVASGTLVAGALLSLFHALKSGDVAVVSPISATQPLAVFALSILLLRDLEQLDLSTITAGLAIVIGAIMVAL